MSEPTYAIVVTETERTAFAKVLGGLVTKFINAPIFVEAPSGGTQQARSVLSPPSTPAAAPATPPPIEQRDRWAEDRRIKAPQDAGIFWAKQGAVAREVRLCKTEQKTPQKTGGKQFLKVTWESETKGFLDANCFDRKLWPWLINQSGKRTTVYLLKAGANGEYVNVVGVRA